MIKVKCIKGMIAHWGSMLIPGQEYDASIVLNNIEVITNFDKYWECNELIASNYLKYKNEYKLKYPNSEDIFIQEQNKYMNDMAKCVKVLEDVQHFSVKCSDGNKKLFYLLSYDELYNLGSDEYGNQPCFTHTVYKASDYFDYKQYNRERVLNELGIN